MMDVAVLAASGAVGQRFIERLDGHPLFRVRHVVGNPDKRDQRYAAATTWRMDDAMPDVARDLLLQTVDDLLAAKPCIVFSALPGGTAGPLESRLAAAGFHVYTNARDHRMGNDVPLLVPEINAEHAKLADHQTTRGRIVANGNCGAIILQLALAPVHRALGVTDADIVTMQALSGAGYPGVSALDIEDNLLLHIPGEEDKIDAETRKTLGALKGSSVTPAPMQIHATATRVNVREGHTILLHARLATPTTASEVEAVLREFRGPKEVAGLPSAPERPVHVFTDADRPQPRLDRDLEGGMAVAAGRVRVGGAGKHLRLAVLGSNTIRGAAGQSILNAEHAHATGRLVGL